MPAGDAGGRAEEVDPAGGWVTTKRRLRHNRIRPNKPPHLRQVVAGVHIDEPQVVAGVVHPVAGEAAVADAGVDRSRRRGAISSMRIAAG